MRKHPRSSWLGLMLLLSFTAQAPAKIALLLEEPFGTFGYVNPTGHAAIYLSDVCAASPTQLRPCKPGEYGVVLSRYYHVAGYDWLAIPLIPYLYAVDSISAVPETGDRATELTLRDAWRREHLRNLVLGMTTPKQLAKDLVRYAGRHEQLDLEIFVLPQVEGSIRRSDHIDGVAEAILRKKYVIPIAFLQPYCAAGFAVTYLTTGRFNPNKNAVPLDRTDLVKSLVDQGPPVPQEGVRSPLIVQLSPHMTPAKHTVSAK